MSYVSDLLPGDRIERAPMSGATYVAQTAHPIWPSLRLVIWRLDDRTWSHDALDPSQYVGEAVISTNEERQARLRSALLSPDRSVSRARGEDQP